MITDIQIHNVLLLQQSEIAKTELKEMRQQNKILANEKWELGQETAKLYRQLKQVETSCLSKT